MGSLSDFAENELMDHIFNAAYTPVATVYMGLCTADPTDAATGAACNEVANSGNYARTAIAFSAAATRKVVQDGAVVFPQASGSWGTVTHYVIVDSGTYGEGNVLAHGTCTPNFSPVSGNTPTVATTQVQISIAATTGGAGLSTYLVHKLLDLMFRNQAFTSPQGNTFIALLAAVADDDDAAVSDLTEITGTDYARKEVNPNGGSSPTWDLCHATTGNVDNTHDVTFPTVGAGGWTAITSMAIVDSASGAGNVLCYDNDNIVNQTPAAGDTVKFVAGALDITLT